MQKNTCYNTLFHSEKDLGIQDLQNSQLLLIRDFNELYDGIFINLEIKDYIHTFGISEKRIIRL